MFVFRGNYIISGTISCVHKKPDDEPRFDSSSGFHFGLRVFSQPLFLLGITEKYRKQDMSSFVISSQSSETYSAPCPGGCLDGGAG